MKRVVRLRSRGYRNHEIAEIFGVSTEAIEQHCYRILQRTGYKRIKDVRLDEKDWINEKNWVTDTIKVERQQRENNGGGYDKKN
ncbi:MAG: hypothetical protein AB1775_03490 [Bacteroidota bacterium]